MAMDFRGDPASALLEVLDPEQNHTFSDHYMEVDFDLSDVMFVATSNSMNIPGPLLDRMEVIRIPGYTEDEKLNIAMKYLVPKQIKENGLKDDEMELSSKMRYVKLFSDIRVKPGSGIWSERYPRSAAKRLRACCSSHRLRKITVTSSNIEQIPGC